MSKPKLISVEVLELSGLSLKQKTFISVIFSSGKSKCKTNGTTYSADTKSVQWLEKLNLRLEEDAKDIVIKLIAARSVLKNQVLSSFTLNVKDIDFEGKAGEWHEMPKVNAKIKLRFGYLEMYDTGEKNSRKDAEIPDLTKSKSQPGQLKVSNPEAEGEVATKTKDDSDDNDTSEASRGKFRTFRSNSTNRLSSFLSLRKSTKKDLKAKSEENLKTGKAGETIPEGEEVVKETKETMDEKRDVKNNKEAQTTEGEIQQETEGTPPKESDKEKEEINENKEEISPVPSSKVDENGEKELEKDTENSKEQVESEVKTNTEGGVEVENINEEGTKEENKEEKEKVEEEEIKEQVNIKEENKEESKEGNKDNKEESKTEENIPAIENNVENEEKKADDDDDNNNTKEKEENGTEIPPVIKRTCSRMESEEQKKRRRSLLIETTKKIREIGIENVEQGEILLHMLQEESELRTDTSLELETEMLELMKSVNEAYKSGLSSAIKEELLRLLK